MIKYFVMFVCEIVGGMKMFLTTLIQTLFKLVVIGVAAFGGILLGKYLRKKKEEKDEK